jgi:hypothetical protein
MSNKKRLTEQPVERTTARRCDRSTHCDSAVLTDPPAMSCSLSRPVSSELNKDIDQQRRFHIVLRTFEEREDSDVILLERGSQRLEARVGHVGVGRIENPRERFQLAPEANDQGEHPIDFAENRRCIRREKTTETDRVSVTTSQHGKRTSASCDRDIRYGRRRLR